MWSLFVGWSVISFGFYLFSVYVGWDWLDNRLKDTQEGEDGSSSSSNNNNDGAGKSNSSVCGSNNNNGQQDGQDTETERKDPTSNWSFASGLPRTKTRVITSSKVREYLEQLVVKQLGGSPLDLNNTAAVNQPKYRKFVQIYHGRLTSALVELGESLHLRTPDYDNDGNPSTYSQPAVEPAHENFIKLLIEVKEAAMEVGPIEDDQAVISKSLKNDEDATPVITATATPTTTTLISTDYGSTTTTTNNVNSNNYEEILSTAILNKVITDVGLGGNRKSLSPVISVVDSAVQTDNDGELSGTGSEKYNVKSWVDGFSNFSDDDISLGTSSSNWSGGDGAHPPVVHQIEEHVEITYETNETAESDTSQESSSPLPPHQQQRPRKGKKIKQQPVPFPEHGVDIVDSHEELDEETEPSKKISQVLAWEENWLFKRKKKPILFSKMAAEPVPMLVPNPSTSPENELNDLNDMDDGDKMSDIEDDDFNGGYFEFPEGHTTETNNNINVNNNHHNEDGNEDDEPSLDVKWPQDVEIAAGKTARISVTIPDPEFAPPSWCVVKSKRILAPTRDKFEIKADPPKYTLIIHNAQDSDAGLYQILLKRNNKLGTGSEISRNFRLTVKAAEKKKCTPVITVFPDVLHFTKAGNPLTVDFELSGHPEPVLNVFKGNDIITSLENKGKGRWTLTLKWESEKEARKIPGEYVAVATNTQGTSRATFRIDADDDMSTVMSPKPTQIKQAEPARSKSRTPEVEEEPRSSSASPAEETLKETSHSIVTNDTVEMEEDDHNRRFTVAEREKSKWANPVELDFNPYAPENLAKRIRAGRNSRDLLVGRGSAASVSPEPVVEDSFLRRDVKKHSTPEPNIVMVEKPAKVLPSDLGGVKLPSVKELAQHFAPVTEKSPSEINKPLPAHRELAKSIQVHSLTARSVSREFREGLKISKGPINNTAQNNVKLSNVPCNINNNNSNGVSGENAINISTVSNENTAS